MNRPPDFTSDPGDAAFFPDGIRRTNYYNAGGALTMRQHLLKEFLDRFRPGSDPDAPRGLEDFPASLAF
jgi:hypothetical protein